MSVLDSSMRSKPLYAGASAVGFCDLMDPYDHLQTNRNDEYNKQPQMKPTLLRSRSENSTMFEHLSVANSSIIDVPQKLASSILNSSSILNGPDFIGWNSKKGKASSVVSGAELREKPKLR